MEAEGPKTAPVVTLRETGRHEGRGALQASLAAVALALFVLLGTPGAEAHAVGDAVDGAPSAVDPYFPGLGNSGYDVSHYNVALRIDPGRRLMEGSVRVELVPDVTLRSFTFDFVGFDVGEVEVDATAARFERNDKKLRIFPATSLSRGSPVEVRISYEGRPRNPSSRTGWLWFGEGGALLSPQPSGARTLFPSATRSTTVAR